MAYKDIFNHNFMVAYAGANNAQMIGSMAGESIKIMNFTNYGVTVKITQEVIDYIPPYQYLIMPNNTAIELILDTVSSAAYVYPYASVTAKTFDEVLSYLIGSLLYFTTQSPGDTVNVAGNMTINGTPNVNIGNTPSVTITGTPNINIANVPSMNINSSSTLPVSFVGTQNVNIANTPSMNIASGSVNATIQNASINSSITNASLSTNPLVISNTTTTAISNLANNASIFVIVTASSIGIFDQVYTIYFTTFNAGVLCLNKYKITLVGVYLSAYGLETSHPNQQVLPASQTNTFGSSLANSITPATFDELYYQVTNISGATIVSDSLQLRSFCKYTTQQLALAVPASANAFNITQGTTGPFFATTIFSAPTPPGLMMSYSISVLNTSGMVLPSNAALLIFDQGGTIPYGIINISNMAIGAALSPTVFDFSPGVANTGLAAQLINVGAGKTIQVAVYAVL